MENLLTWLTPIVIFVMKTITTQIKHYEEKNYRALIVFVITILTTLIIVLWLYVFKTVQIDFLEQQTLPNALAIALVAGLAIAGGYDVAKPLATATVAKIEDSAKTNELKEEMINVNHTTLIEPYIDPELEEEQPEEIVFEEEENI